MLYDFLNLIVGAGATGGAANLISAYPAVALLPFPANILTIIYWIIVALEAWLVAEVIKVTDTHNGITVNISFIPLSLDALSAIGSLGADSPEIPMIVEGLEQATLLEELANPGAGSMWYSLFWITGN